MTKIFIIRHCEAEGNIYRRAQGQHDGKISPKGKLQIAALAERFRNEAVDAVYSSDLERARLTAGAILTHHNLQLHLDRRLREWKLGVWEDRPFGNLEYSFPEMLFNFNNDPAAWHVEGGEAWGSLCARVQEAIREIALRHSLRHPLREIALGSHGDGQQHAACGEHASKNPCCVLHRRYSLYAVHGSYG